MDDLTYSLRVLCQRNRDGSHATQADRMRTLTLASRQLHEVGFRQMQARSLKGKHVQALLERWQAEGLSAGTLKNRMAHLRWWAEKVGKGGIIPTDNARLAIPDRRFVTNEDKAQRLGTALDRVSDPHVHASLVLQQEFGLRREEAIKFRPSYADRVGHILLKGSWTKGGRPRVVPITSPEQRAALDEAHRVAGAGSLIPADKSYVQQRHTYEWQCKSAGLSHMHGLRHLYAQTRYEELTGWKAPAAGPVANQNICCQVYYGAIVCGAHYTITNATSYGCSTYHDGHACSNSILVRRDRIEQILLGPIRDKLPGPERVASMAKEMQEYYRQRTEAIQPRAVETPQELEDLAARIERLRGRLRRGDPDMTHDELQAAIEKAEEKRRELQEQQRGLKSPAKALANMPRMAELYRRQVALGLDGNPQAALKARTFLREWFGGKIRLEPLADGGLMAHWNQNIGALVSAVGTCGSGGLLL
jgi:hypothetical protein